MTSENDTPDRQVWSRAADGGLKPAEFGTFTTPLIRKTDTVAAVGTMLAARLLVAMRVKKFSVIRVDPPHPAFADIPPETDEYLSFSAGYGEVWNARELRQLVRRADRSFVPAEVRWHEGDLVVDPYRPGLRYPARSDQEFDLLCERHMNAVRSAFRRCSTLLVALGASEICETVADGAVIPARSGAESRGLDPERHVFRTLTVAETIADLNDAIDGLRTFNPGMAIILMISPEPLTATATPAHVVTAGAHGKAILRVAMEEVAGRPGVSYFPALEIVGTSGIATFGPEGRTLTSKAVTLVATALVEACEGGSIEMVAPERPQPLPIVTEKAAPVTEPAVAEPTEVPTDPAAAARAKRVAARAAAAAETPPSPKRAVATVVDAYSGTVPSKARKAKVPKEPKPAKAAPDPAIIANREEAAKKVAEKAAERAAAAEKRKAEVEKKKEAAKEKEALRKERAERRTTREALHAERRKTAAAVSETASSSPEIAVAKAPKSSRKRSRVAGEATPPRQRKSRAASPPAEAAKAPEAQHAPAPRKKGRAKAAAPTDRAGSAAAPRNRKRATDAAKADASGERPTGTREEKRAERKRRNLENKSAE